MAWTAPRTWVTGEIVTAALMNTHVRDNLSYLKDTLPFATTDTEPARVFDTIYENTSGKIRIVIISVSLTAAEGASFEIGSASPPDDEIWHSINTADECPITAVVPPAYFYRLNDDQGGPSIFQWHEYDLH